MTSPKYPEFRTTSTSFLFEMLRQSIEQEQALVDDVHSLIIDARVRCESNLSDEAPLFAVLDRVLEPAGVRPVIEELVNELQGRMAPTADTSKTQAGATPAALGEPS